MIIVIKVLFIKIMHSGLAGGHMGKIEILELK